MERGQTDKQSDHMTPWKPKRKTPLFWPTRRFVLVQRLKNYSTNIYKAQNCRIELELHKEISWIKNFSQIMPNKAKSFELQFMCHGWHLICFDLVSVQWSGAWAGFVSSHVSLSFAEWAFSTTNETECTIWFRLKGVTYSHSLIHFSSHASLIYYS